MEQNLSKQKLENSLLELGDSLTIAWSEYSKNIKQFLILVVIINLPLALINLYLTSLVKTDTSGSGGITIEGNKGIFVLGWLVYVVIASLVSLASHKIIERSILNQHYDAITALKNSLPQVLIYLVISLILSFLIGLGFVFLIIPGIWLAVKYSFTTQAIALRNCGLNSFDYSSSIIKGRWWSLFGKYILLSLCGLLIFIPLLIVTGIVTGLTTIVNLGFVAQILSAIINGLVSYYFLAVTTVIFLNFDYTHQKQQESLPTV